MEFPLSPTARGRIKSDEHFTKIKNRKLEPYSYGLISWAILKYATLRNRNREWGGGISKIENSLWNVKGKFTNSLYKSIIWWPGITQMGKWM